MRFQPLFLIGEIIIGEDVLGNSITAPGVISESSGRFSSWTSEEIALDQRDVTKNNRKIITRAKKSDLVLAHKVQIDGKYHSITEIKGDDTSRWRIIVVNRYGSEKL